MTKIGVISDTHGLVRDQVYDLFDGCDVILHAGDIGKYSVLEKLKKIAPVIAVIGNVDKDGWAEEIVENKAIEIEGKSIYLLHNIQELDLQPKGQFDIVVYGHSHQPVNEEKDGVLYFNPGSAGPRRFKLPIAVGIIVIEGCGISAEILELSG
ncbi:metallophosphoesterase family protein [Halioxenophilus sp. WMMB6]|uniref:metallophosphoesterase family protein n=1 Tax=Halioxenophilus sp. WMMB6 TaxID=3073815 RepID=UPI00295F1AFB|nr:metallophosphoesterase family protein [Halioxenophilus sp. WMMB6]